ncbi:MAG: hypothetical protein AAFQ92_23570 [Bacteroidota bacterium]
MTMQAEKFLRLGDEDVRDESEYHPIYKAEYDSSGAYVKKITLLYYELIKLLKDLGFRRLDLAGNSFIIQLVDGVIKEMQQQDVVDEYEDYLNSFGVEVFNDQVQKSMLLNKVYGSINTYFSKQVLSRLRSDDDLTIKQHTRDAGYFYYRNGFVEVKKDGYKFHEYSELEGVIWGNQILNRDFEEVPAKVYENTNFAKFVKNIANYWEVRFYDKEKNPNPDHDRYLLFKAIIGNALHSYFDGKLKAVIFTDSRVSDDASGRTGKTLIMKAAGHMLNTNKQATTYVELNGKDFDPNDRFKYQQLAIDTRLVHINDVKAGFDFETLFNDITEGIMCQKKNETPFLVPAKIYLTTNKIIHLPGDSAKDRSTEFEMADYYCAANGPDQEFDEWFFTDWDKEDWNAFDNFMISCLQIYLQKGLQTAEGINLMERKLRAASCPEFILFMEELKIKHLEEWKKRELFSRFLELNPDYSKFQWMRQRKFTTWLQKYAEYHPSVERIHERRSNNIDYFSFSLKGKGGVGDNKKSKDGDDLPF